MSLENWGNAIWGKVLGSSVNLHKSNKEHKRATNVGLNSDIDAFKPGSNDPWPWT